MTSKRTINLKKDFLEVNSLSQKYITLLGFFLCPLFTNSFSSCYTLYINLITGWGSSEHKCEHNHLRNVIDSPAYECGSQLETPYHYFLECSNYDVIRDDLLRIIRPITAFNLKLLLYSSEKLTFELNAEIVDAVHSFIVSSEQFQ